MTRFKELRRIERAIEHQDQGDLRWALDYCQLRLRMTRTKQGASHWKNIEKRVQKRIPPYGFRTDSDPRALRCQRRGQLNS